MRGHAADNVTLYVIIVRHADCIVKLVSHETRIPVAYLVSASATQRLAHGIPWARKFRQSVYSIRSLKWLFTKPPVATLWFQIAVKR